MNDGDGYPTQAVGGSVPVRSSLSTVGLPPAAAPVGGPARGIGGAPVDDHADVRAVRPPGHLGALSVGQLIIAEVAVLLAVGAAARGLLPGVLAGTAAAVLITVCFARRHDRWWLADRMVAWQHRRRRSATLEAGGGTIRALRPVAPGLSVRDVSTSDGARTGVARDDAGWFSVVALAATAPVHQEAPPVPLDTLVDVLTATEQPGVVLQLVTHTVPAPSLDVHPASPAGSSYRQLATSLSPVAVPAHRESSVGIRIDARRLAEALLDHNADPDTAAALVASLGRKTATSLRRLGIACRVLDGDALTAALARSCDLEAGTLGDAAQVREEWTHWRSARLTHRTFWLKTWPSSTAQIGALLNWASTAPAAQTSVAVILDPADDGEVAVRALIRLAARPEDDFAVLEHHLVEGVKRFGGELRALDGEQGPAAYATAPTGGGAG